MDSTKQLRLTERELNVLRLVAQGYTDRQIGATLCIAPSTVRRHLDNISGKLGARGRIMVVVAALSYEIIPLAEVKAFLECRMVVSED